VDPVAAAGTSAPAGGWAAVEADADGAGDGGSVAALPATDDADATPPADEGVCGAWVAGAAAMSADGAAAGCTTPTTGDCSGVILAGQCATPVRFALRWATGRAMAAAAPSVAPTAAVVPANCVVVPAGSWLAAGAGPGDGGIGAMGAGRRTGDAAPTEAPSTAMASAAPASSLAAGSADASDGIADVDGGPGMAVLTTEDDDSGGGGGGGGGGALARCPRLASTDADGVCSADTRGLKGDVAWSLWKIVPEPSGVRGSGTSASKRGCSVSSPSAAARTGATAFGNGGKLDGTS